MTPSTAKSPLSQGLKSWAAAQSARPMVRQGGEAIVEPVEATELPEKLEDDQLPLTDRRLHARFAARPGAIAEIRRWAIGSKTDFAVQLVDLSISGVRVQLNRVVQTGERFEVTLWAPNRAWSIRCMGVVRWCQLAADGRIMSGLRLSRPIAPRDLAELVG